MANAFLQGLASEFAPTHAVGVDTMEAASFAVESAVDAMRSIIAMESAVIENFNRIFGGDAEVTMESISEYERTTSLILAAGGLTVPVKLLSVSFESEEGASKEKAEEKKDGFLKATGKAIMEAIRKFFAWIKGLFSKKSEKMEKKAQEAEEIVEEVKTKSETFEEKVERAAKAGSDKARAEADARKAAEPKDPVEYKIVKIETVKKLETFLSQATEVAVELTGALKEAATSKTGIDYIDFKVEDAKDLFTRSQAFIQLFDASKETVKVSSYKELEADANRYKKTTEEIAAMIKNAVSKFEKANDTLNNQMFGSGINTKSRKALLEAISNLERTVKILTTAAEKSLEIWEKGIRTAMTEIGI